MLADEQQAAFIAFLCPRVGCSKLYGVEYRQVMSGNGPAYASNRFAKVCRTLFINPILTKPYTYRTTAETERFIEILC